ncbi:Octicosapeptide/Phox/Bem1p [Quillaja saponaria]|uniref:Octicosapeptide/Phox/Bem1p n=1 Tax=Quillaja saponaria TaxID=32244 RepID=A0AAD7M3N1_QUISA|nr:Octicosapeptide/Phox/Bem1p [Quillaja saponaria]
MTSYHPTDLDSVATDSVASSPRSDYFPSNHDLLPHVRFMCSFGGKIIPRPHDNQLRYVGGDTRIVAVHRSTSFSGLLSKLYKLSGMTDITVKYQLPNEDLDALISVTTDEDVENMIDEYDRIAPNQNSKSARLRLFLFPKGEDSRTSTISSILDGSANRENWFVDALNGGRAGLERGRQKSEMLFMIMYQIQSPGSPVPVVSSPFCSTSSAPCVPSIPNLPPVRTRSDSPAPVVDSKQNQLEGFAEQQKTVHSGQQVPAYSIPEFHHSGQPVQPVPFYYVTGQAPPGNLPVQTVPMRAPYVQPYPGMPGQGQIGFHHLVPGAGQIYGGGMKPVHAVDPYNPSAAARNQQVYYGGRNSGPAPVYPMMMVPGGEESHGGGSEINMGRFPRT